MFIAPQAKVLRHLDRLSAWQQGEKPAPVTVEVDLSSRCYLGCASCHFAYTHTRGPWTVKPRMLPMLQDRAGDLADLNVLVPALRDMRHANVRAVVWSGGGEPTTHPQWQEAVTQAHFIGLEQGMYTAGGLLTEQSALHLATCATWVVVSLDCVDAETYAREKGVAPALFDRACQGVRWLSQGAATIGVSFLLHAGNFARVYEMRSLAKSLGATYVTFRPTIQTDPAHPNIPLGDRSWVTRALPYLTNVAAYSDVELDVSRFVQWRDWQQHPYSACQGIRLTGTTITPDGRVWICPNRREYPDSCLGDLRTESFSTIWARHPGSVVDFSLCRAMCRLNPINEQVAALAQPRAHEAFL